MVSDEQEFAAHHAASTAARRDVMRRLALATGLQRAVELADQVDPAEPADPADPADPMPSGGHVDGLTAVP
jgi:hypothetical protein